MKATLASLHSILRDPAENLRRVERACVCAAKEGARLVLLPELMLTGHGAHPKMTANAESVPDGPLSRAILALSEKHALCICVGIAERDGARIYNSQMVADRGRFLGLQRKIHLSGDEYLHFGAGEDLPLFDIGEARLGILICYDNLFPELALAHALQGADVILAPHAARMGTWPARMTRAQREKIIHDQQQSWELVHRARAYDHNLHVLLCNAAGPSTDGLEGVEANHAGTVMGIDPRGDVFLRSAKHDFSDEIVTVELPEARRKINHPPSRNRRPATSLDLLQRAAAAASAATLCKIQPKLP